MNCILPQHQQVNACISKHHSSFCLCRSKPSTTPTHLQNPPQTYSMHIGLCGWGLSHALLLFYVKRALWLRLHQCFIAFFLCLQGLSVAEARPSSCFIALYKCKACSLAEATLMLHCLFNVNTSVCSWDYSHALLSLLFLICWHSSFFPFDFFLNNQQKAQNDCGKVFQTK